MKAFHSFHDGYDLSLPEPSARKGYVLPKIEKKKVKKKPFLQIKKKLCNMFARRVRKGIRKRNRTTNP